eukprot:137604-Ditylum_brightwellii.AAC.1
MALPPKYKCDDSNKNLPIQLDNFLAKGTSLIDSQQVMALWLTRKKTSEQQAKYTERTQYVCRVILTQSVQLDQVSNVMIKQALYDQDIAFAWKVSATSLINPDLPASLKAHDSMLPDDKEIWDHSYAKEYFGQHNNTRTWQYISEDKYNLLKPTVDHALPTIAMATVKHNKNGKP